MTASLVLAAALVAPAAPEPEPPVNVKETVSKGLKWLAEQQKADGSWVSRADSAPTTTTALAGLALLMQGSTPSNGTYAPQLRKAIDWQELNVGPGGALVANRTELARPTSPHAHALLFLACAYDVDDDAERRARVRTLLVDAVKYSVEAQGARGGWAVVAEPSATRGNEDALSTIMMLQALAAARKAGIAVPKDTTKKAAEFLAKCTGPSGDVRQRLDGAGSAGQPHFTAGAAVALLTLDAERPEAVRGWIDALSFRSPPTWPTTRPTAATLALNFQTARVAWALGEDGHQQLDRTVNGARAIKWSAYRAAAFKSIKDAQTADGSWGDPPVSGPVQPSAMALIILQLENDYLPAFSR